MSSINAVRQLVASRSLRHAVALLLLQFVAIGLLAVGASGVLAAGGRALWGDRFVGADPEGQAYTASRCRELREYAPSATSCLDAAASHHSDEVVFVRLCAGALGFGVLGVWAWLRRRQRGVPLPEGVVAAIGVTAFGIAAAVCAVLATNGIVAGPGGGGAGQWISAGVVSAAVALWFGSKLLDALVDAVA